LKADADQFADENDIDHIQIAQGPVKALKS